MPDVQSMAIGRGARPWQFVVAVPDAQIGDCNICSNCLIENDVATDNRVPVKNSVQPIDGLSTGKAVLSGPIVTFTRDKHPTSRNTSFNPNWTSLETGSSVLAVVQLF